MNFVAVKMLTGDRSKYLGIDLRHQRRLDAHGPPGVDLRQHHVAHDEPDPGRARRGDLGDGSAAALRRRDRAPLRQRPLSRPRRRGRRVGGAALQGHDPDEVAGGAHARRRPAWAWTTRRWWGRRASSSSGPWPTMRGPDAVIVDEAGYRDLWPGEPLTLGKTLEMNDRRGVVVAIADSSAPFLSTPLLYTRYSQAVSYVGRERNLMSFVLVHPKPGVDPPRAHASGSRPRRDSSARDAGRVGVGHHPALPGQHGHPGQLRHHDARWASSSGRPWRARPSTSSRSTT